MRKYWSASKLSNWIYGGKPPYPKTISISGNEFEDRHQLMKEQKPIRYWISETFLDWLQDVVYFPYDFLIGIRSYYRNRFVVKTHVLISSLPKGKWHDLDTRILYANFDSLVWHVEEELLLEASEGQTGVDVLNWHCDHQPHSDSYKKVRKLYNWWKFERPAKEKAIADDLEAEDTKMLCELMKIRGTLWV